VGTLNYEWGPPRDRKQGLIFEQRWQNCWFYVLTAAIFLQAEGRTILAVAASGHTHDSGVPSERVPGRTQCSGNLIANTRIRTSTPPSSITIPSSSIRFTQRKCTSTSPPVLFVLCTLLKWHKITNNRCCIHTYVTSVISRVILSLLLKRHGRHPASHTQVSGESGLYTLRHSTRHSQSPKLTQQLTLYS
jgi:hypothetical protein